jgi:hypothetical protein
MKFRRNGHFGAAKQDTIDQRPGNYYYLLSLIHGETCGNRELAHTHRMQPFIFISLWWSEGDSTLLLMLQSKKV